jgi:hypothetical protein
LSYENCDTPTGLTRVNERVPWRTGRSVGRTIYACPPGSSYRNGEALIGIMDTPELADAAVTAHNAWLAECDEFGCHGQETDQP